MTTIQPALFAEPEYTVLLRYSGSTREAWKHATGLKDPSSRIREHALEAIAAAVAPTAQDARPLWTPQSLSGWAFTPQGMRHLKDSVFVDARPIRKLMTRHCSYCGIETTTDKMMEVGELWQKERAFTRRFVCVPGCLDFWVQS